MELSEALRFTPDENDAEYRRFLREVYPNRRVLWLGEADLRDLCRFVRAALAEDARSKSPASSRINRARLEFLLTKLEFLGWHTPPEPREHDCAALGCATPHLARGSAEG